MLREVSAAAPEQEDADQLRTKLTLRVALFAGVQAGALILPLAKQGEATAAFVMCGVLVATVACLAGLSRGLVASAWALLGLYVASAGAGTALLAAHGADVWVQLILLAPLLDFPVDIFPAVRQLAALSRRA